MGQKWVIFGDLLFSALMVELCVDFGQKVADLGLKQQPSRRSTKNDLIFKGWSRSWAKVDFEYPIRDFARGGARTTRFFIGWLKSRLVLGQIGALKNRIFSRFVKNSLALWDFPKCDFSLFTYARFKKSASNGLLWCLRFLSIYRFWAHNTPPNLSFRQIEYPVRGFQNVWKLASLRVVF